MLNFQSERKIDNGCSGCLRYMILLGEHFTNLQSMNMYVTYGSNGLKDISLDTQLVRHIYCNIIKIAG